MIFKSNLWFKWAILLIVWSLSILVVITAVRNNDLKTSSDKPANCEPDYELPKNQIGAFAYIRRDPNENARPVYSVRGTNLWVENNKLGIFKTGLHKLIKITDLEIAFYQYNSGPDSSQENSAGTCDLETAAQDLPTLWALVKETTPVQKNKEISTLTGIFGKWTQPGDGWRIVFDVSNTTEVLIDNFDYKVFHDGNLFFGVESKKATASYKQSGLVLRGHVTIRTADGCVLESNCVTWDMHGGRFIVRGTCFLNHNGVKTIGRDICVDARLNVIKA